MERDFWGTYVGNNRVLMVPKYGGVLYGAADDLSLTPRLLVNGVFEPELTNYLMRTLKKGMVVCDIGANVGYFSVLAGYLVGSGGTVIAFEPNPELYSLLADNMIVNEHARFTSTVPKAVSDVNGPIAFYVSKRFRGNGSSQRHSPEYKAAFHSDTFEEIAVESVVFDDYCEQHLLKAIDLVKIDVEGAEYRVLKGMEKSLTAGHIKRVVFELNKSMLQGDIELLLDLLKQCRQNQGATFHHIHEDGALEHRSLETFFELPFIPNILMQLGGGTSSAAPDAQLQSAPRPA